jgi:hypothetical protein
VHKINRHKDFLVAVIFYNDGGLMAMATSITTSFGAVASTITTTATASSAKHIEHTLDFFVGSRT